MSGVILEQEEIDKIFSHFAFTAQQQITEKLNKLRKRVIVIAGPTGCGKSAFALQLALHINGEIISADSMQVYRHMDIGSAKPTVAERALVPHHLVDVRDIKESFNVVDFYYEARHCCQEILSRNKVPIVVGGAGFYIHSLLYGPPSGPPSVPEVRAGLEQELKTHGAQLLYARLEQLDPEYARTITKNDKQKIVRALEIIALTGKKVSKLSWKERRKAQNYDFRCWFMHRPRPSLYARINERCDKMLEEGFLEEVKKLEAEGLRENSSAVQAIGYRQALEYLETAQTAQDYEKFVCKFKQASRNYAKRQCVWFAREPLFTWLDMDLHDTEVIMDHIEQDYFFP